jgi:hypothetical protein
LRRDI